MCVLREPSKVRWEKERAKKLNKSPNARLNHIRSKLANCENRKMIMDKSKASNPSVRPNKKRGRGAESGVVGAATATAFQVNTDSRNRKIITATSV